MGNSSSRPKSEQHVSKNEPNQPSSTSSVSGGTETSAAASQPSTLSDDRTVRKVAPFLTADERQALASTSQHHTGIIYADPHDETFRNKKITLKLLQAVANGMESREANVDPREANVDPKLKLKLKDLFAEDLLRLSPEFLLEKVDFTDWGGRIFKKISAFQYALWAKDFKMIEMMLKSIPVGEEGDAIRTELLRQYEQVTIPRGQGGGLTYTHTYERPKLDAAGIPIKDASGNWDCETVTEERWGNHFDITPLLNAYEDYITHFDARNWDQRNAFWIKIIGTLQRLLPIHILQRYCDPNVPFNPLPSFTGNFQRTTQFYHYLHKGLESLLSSSLASDFSLVRGGKGVGGASWWGAARIDMAAVRQLDEVSTNEREKIKQLLAAPGESPTQFRP